MLTGQFLTFPLMIILDTNILSELIKREPNTAVLTWLQGCRVSDLFTTTISESEMRIGAAQLPAGKRRDQLEAAIDRTFEEKFSGRILSFDRAAAGSMAGVFEARKNAGRPISFADNQIAAIALAHTATLATRNIKDFISCGIDIIDPWDC